MIEINKEEKDRLIYLIENNDLDYTISNSDIFKFSLLSSDNKKFFFYKVEEKYIVMKYDVNKDSDNNIMENAYEYFEFNNINQILEQLTLYDNSLEKNYWGYCNSIDFNFNKDNYNNNWSDEFIKENYRIIESDHIKYNYLIYENNNIKPKLLSPYNILHEVSMINSKEYTLVDKLYFEIHPESCVNKSESYILKLLCNNDDILKEYINYRVKTKKGLKLLIESIFKQI